MDVGLYQKRMVRHAPDMRLVHYHRISGSLWFLIGAIFGIGFGLIAGMIIMREIQKPSTPSAPLPMVNSTPPSLQ